MQNNLIIWEKAIQYGRKYDIDKVVEDNTGLTLYLTDVDIGKKIILVYDSVVCSYKNTEESFWINALDQVENNYENSFISKHTFFKVQNSTYAKEVENGSCGSVHADSLCHLKVIAANAIFDIISFREPVIKEND